MTLCDTNILIEANKGNMSVIDRMEAIGFINLSVSDVTKAEVICGAS